MSGPSPNRSRLTSDDSIDSGDSTVTSPDWRSRPILNPSNSQSRSILNGSNHGNDVASSNHRESRLTPNNLNNGNGVVSLPRHFVGPLLIERRANAGNKHRPGRGARRPRKPIGPSRFRPATLGGNQNKVRIFVDHNQFTLEQNVGNTAYDNGGSLSVAVSPPAAVSPLTITEDAAGFLTVSSSHGHHVNSDRCSIQTVTYAESTSPIPVDFGSYTGYNVPFWNEKDPNSGLLESIVAPSLNSGARTGGDHGKSESRSCGSQQQHSHVATEVQCESYSSSTHQASTKFTVNLIFLL